MFSGQSRSFYVDYCCAVALFTNSAVTWDSAYEMRHVNDMIGVSYTENDLLGYKNVLQCPTH